MSNLLNHCSQVTFSMLEIYNEEVRDLLNKKKTPHGGLKIKENVDRGFYGEYSITDH